MKWILCLHFMSWVQSHRNRVGFFFRCLVVIVWDQMISPNINLVEWNRISKPEILTHNTTEFRRVRRSIQWVHYGICHILEWQSETNMWHKHHTAHIDSLLFLQWQNAKKRSCAIQQTIGKMIESNRFSSDMYNNSWRHVHSTDTIWHASLFFLSNFQSRCSFSVDRFILNFSLNINLICVRMTDTKRRRRAGKKITLLAFIVHHSFSFDASHPLSLCVYVGLFIFNQCL